MDDKNKIKERIKQIISERLEINIENIKPESELKNDLGIDSFGFVEMIYEVKEKFGINIEDKDFSTIKKVEDVVSYIFNKTKEK